MIVAIKDDLQIEITLEDKKVKIHMPDMQDILFLWESWIRQEEVLAENFLKNQASKDPYHLLLVYLKANGWDIIKTGFSQS